ncbi:MAG: hypothetical protein RML56_06000 [Burkholderiales bacterium]|nr:hypothetical protein [Burkholderiales bacterium]
MTPAGARDSPTEQPKSAQRKQQPAGAMRVAPPTADRPNPRKESKPTMIGTDDQATRNAPLAVAQPAATRVATARTTKPETKTDRSGFAEISKQNQSEERRGHEQQGHLVRVHGPAVEADSRHRAVPEEHGDRLSRKMGGEPQLAPDHHDRSRQPRDDPRDFGSLASQHATAKHNAAANPYARRSWSHDGPVSAPVRTAIQNPIPKLRKATAQKSANALATSERAQKASGWARHAQRISPSSTNSPTPKVLFGS